MSKDFKCSASNIDEVLKGGGVPFPTCFSSAIPLLALTAASLALGGGTLSAQSPSLIDRSVDARRIILDVVARPGIEASSAVIVTDNGKRIPTDQLRLISQEAGYDASPQLLIVIDAVNTGLQDLARSEDAVQAILKASHGLLPQLTSVVILSDTAGHASGKTSPQDTASRHEHELFAHRIPATRDPAAISEELDRYKLGLHRILQAQAGPGQAERVQLSLKALSFLAKAEASEPGAKVVLWIGPGWPLLSRSNSQASEQLFDSIVYFSDLLRSARILLYSVSPEGMTSQDHSAEEEAFMLSSRPNSIRANGYAPNIPVELTPTYYKEFLSGVRKPTDSSPNDLAIQVLAYQSGGLVMQQKNDLKSQIAQCMSDTQHISTLAYDPEAHGGLTVYHAITVTRAVDAQALRTQTGFYTR